MAVAHLPAALFALLSAVSAPASRQAFLITPLLMASPLGVVVAFIRYDLWGSRALLSRVVTRVVVAAVAGLVGVALGAAFASSLGARFGMALVASSAGGLACACFLYVALRFADRTFFPAIAEYKPTVEQLSDDLASLNDPAQVATAIERTVRRWLPCERVALEVVEARAGGAQAREDERAPADALSIPVSFGGAPLGVLHLGQKRGGALYTSEDIDLLRTIANQGALALAYAHSYAELEERRKQQAAAWQKERAALVETIAAEIAHEIRYPINFFRSVFEGRQGKAALEEEEVEIGREEIGRMERLVAGLRRLVVGQLRVSRRAVPLTELVAKVELLLRDTLRSRALQVDVPDTVALVCSPDEITQILVNLVANALEATSAEGRVGLTWASSEDGGKLVVWDSGSGFDVSPSQLFAPWFTTKSRGTGLGLAITQRLVRAHGWRIDATREEGVTRFVISVPQGDVVAPVTEKRKRAEVA
jgi:signal transduction histidine kinase